MKTVNIEKYLAIYASYNELLVGLFDGSQLVCHQVYSDKRLSSFLLLALEEVLQSAGWRINDLSCIGVVHGPGAFSNLRSLLASVNGIAAGTSVPLVGVDGLKLFSEMVAQETVDRALPCLSAVAMKAYNNELFFNLEKLAVNGARTELMSPHYMTITNLAKTIAGYNLPFVVVGNGAQSILSVLSESRSREFVYTSLQLLTLFGVVMRRQFASGQHVSSLQPLYLKMTQFKKSSL